MQSTFCITFCKTAVCSKTDEETVPTWSAVRILWRTVRQHSESSSNIATRVPGIDNIDRYRS